MKSDRLQGIRALLYRQGSASINELVRATSASLPTIRRDLVELEEAGLIDRFHGGARLAQGSNLELDFALREQQDMGLKRAIARAAYALIDPHGSVLLDAGTTVLQVASLLRIEPLPCLVFTNGLRVAQELLNVPRLKVKVIGGSLRNENASFVGPLAEQMIRSIWIDTLMLGVGAIGEDGTIYSVDANEAQLNALMISRSSRHLILATPGKFGGRASFSVGPVPPGAIIITTTGVAPEWGEAARAWGCELLVVDPAHDAGPVPAC